MKNIILFFFATILVSFPVPCADVPRTPLERGGYQKVTTHGEMLAYIRELAAIAPRMKIKSAGTTVEGRSIPVVHVLPAATGHDKIKVLLFCQQHGNEPSGKEAALLLMKSIAEDETNTLYPNLDLTIIPSVNPDGNEAEKRVNANAQDLNRDHLNLSQPETRALHAVFAGLQPEVALDVHEFSIYRKKYLAAGYVYAVDEQLGAPTNLNIPESIREFGLKHLFPFLGSELLKNNVRFGNYTKMDEPSDTARLSTTSIDDGRQSLAILNTFSFILEGKNGRSFHDDLQRRAEGQRAAICAFLRFVNDNSAAIGKLIVSERTTLVQSREPVIVRMDYRYTGETIALPMTLLSSGADTTVAMKYAPLVTPLAKVSRPVAYLIPQAQTSLIAALERLGIHGERIVRTVQKKAEIISITDTKPMWMENKLFTDIATTVRNETVTVQPGDFLVSVSQLASTQIVIALEPTSMWGLLQEEEFALLRMKGTDYPVYRIMN